MADPWRWWDASTIARITDCPGDAVRANWPLIALLQPSPVLTMDDVEDGRFPDPELSGERRTTIDRMAGHVRLSNLKRLRRRQLDSRVGFSPGLSLRTSICTVPLSSGRTPRTDGILSIVGGCTESKMCRLDTGRIAATSAQMTDYQPGRLSSSVGDLPSDTMRGGAFTGNHHVDVVGANPSRSVQQQAASVFIAHEGQCKYGIGLSRARCSVARGAAILGAALPNPSRRSRKAATAFKTRPLNRRIVGRGTLRTHREDPQVIRGAEPRTGETVAGHFVARIVP